MKVLRCEKEILLSWKKKECRVAGLINVWAISVSCYRHPLSNEAFYIHLSYTKKKHFGPLQAKALGRRTPCLRLGPALHEAHNTGPEPLFKPFLILLHEITWNHERELLENFEANSWWSFSEIQRVRKMWI